MTLINRLSVVGTYAAVVLLAGCTAIEYINSLCKKTEAPKPKKKDMVIPIADGRKLVYQGNTIKMIPAPKKETLEEKAEVVEKEGSELEEKTEQSSNPTNMIWINALEKTESYEFGGLISYNWDEYKKLVPDIDKYTFLHEQDVFGWEGKGKFDEGKSVIGVGPKEQEKIVIIRT